MLKLDFSLFKQTRHFGLVRTLNGVCLNSVGCIDIYRLTRQDTPSIEHWPKQSATPPSWLGHHMTDAGLFTLEMGR